jgi:hypothetical protein
MENHFKSFARRLPAPREWKVTSHQFRKTFARFVARNDSMALLALKRHFKHVDVQMTLHYTGMDPLLFDEVLEAKDEYGSELLFAVLGSDRLAGPLGDIVAERNSHFRGVAGREALGEYIQRLRNNTDLIVVPHRYGLCIYRADRASCQGDPGKAGINTCIGCKNFVVSPRHKDYWIERRDELNAFLASLGDQRHDAVAAEIRRADGIIALI